MSSDKNLLKTVDRIIKEKPEMFEAILEFERTGKLPRLYYKKRVNFTIDSKLVKEFQKYCQKHGFKMSTKIESLIKKELNL